MQRCEHVTHDDEGERVCGSSEDVRRFLIGWRCPLHTPAALHDRADTRPACVCPLRCYAHKAATPQPSYIVPKAQRTRAPRVDRREWTLRAKDVILRLGKLSNGFTVADVLDNAGEPPLGDDEIATAHLIVRARAARRHETATGDEQGDRRVAAERAVVKLLTQAAHHGLLETRHDRWRAK